MSFNSVSAILRGRWLIDKQWAEQHLTVVASILKGDGSKYADFLDGKETSKNKVTSILSVHAGLVTRSYYDGFLKAPENSVALIDINGPILKYGDMCSYGSIDYANWIKEADANNNITAIILQIDSPGGEVVGTATLAQVIASTKKPVIAFINDGLCASAALWIASAADQVYASQQTDYVGSVGVFCTLYDFKTYFQNEGLPVHEIYAPQSDQKNSAFREALNGNYEPIQQELSIIADTFINTVKNNRGKLATTNMDSWSHGQIMFAEQAVKIGLIDGLKSFDQVVAIAASTTQKKVSNTNTTTMSLFGKNFPKLSGLKGKKQSEIIESDVDAVNAEILENGIEGLTVVSTNELKDFESKVNSLEEKLTQSSETVKKLQGEVDSFKNNRAEIPTTTPAASTDIIPGSENEDDKYLTETDKQARRIAAKAKK